MSGALLCACNLGSDPLVSFEGAVILDIVTDPDDAEADLFFYNTGAYEQRTVSNGIVGLGSWIDPEPEAGGNYEIQCHVDSGAVSGATTETWLSLDTTRTWSRVRSTIGTAIADVTISIRRVDGPTLHSASFTLSAQVGA